MQITITFLLLLLPYLSYSQKIIEIIKLSNGKNIIIRDNYTWEYTSNSTNKTYGITSSNKTSYNKTSSSKNSSNKRKKTNYKSTNYYKSSYSSYCGALTKSGGSCRRKVSGGGRCWQH